MLCQKTINVLLQLLLLIEQGSILGQQRIMFRNQSTMSILQSPIAGACLPRMFRCCLLLVTHCRHPLEDQP